LLVVNSLYGFRGTPTVLGNELSGGSAAAQRNFLGSNYDWGHDLFRLKRWADQHQGVRPLCVA
jgi:hypothetical protein